MPRPTATTAPTITNPRINVSLLVCRSARLAYERQRRRRLPLRAEEVGSPDERRAQMARDRDECRGTEQRGSVDVDGATGRDAGPRRDQRRADRADGGGNPCPPVPRQQSAGLDERGRGQGPSGDHRDGAHRRPRSDIGDGDGAPGRATRMNGDELCRRGRKDQANRKMNQHRMKSANQPHLSVPLYGGANLAVFAYSDRTCRWNIPRVVPTGLGNDRPSTPMPEYLARHAGLLSRRGRDRGRIRGASADFFTPAYANSK